MAAGGSSNFMQNTVNGSDFSESFVNGSESFRENFDDGSDILFDYICSVCAASNEKKEAVKYCIECKGYCCLTCVQMHSSFPTLKGHSLVETSNLNAIGIAPGPCGTIRDRQTVPNEKCPVHLSQIVDRYCGNHDVVGCSTCISSDHGTCTDLHTIPDSINILYKNSDIDDTNATVQVSRREVAAINKKNEKLMTTLAEVKQKNDESLESFAENMKAALDDFKVETRSTFEETHTKQLDEIVAEKEKVQRIMESIEVNVEKMGKVKGNIVQEFICMKMAQTKTRELKSLDRQTKNKKKVAVIVEQNDYADKLVEYFKKSPAVKPKNIEPNRHSLYTVKQKSKINVRLPSDTSPCCIQGSCLTPTGSLLLVDSNNLKLKLVDLTSLSVIDECYVYRPEDVCCISETEAAVACYSNSIQFISLVDKMTPTTTLEINQYCCGIAYGLGNLFVSDWNSSVFVYDINGHLLKGVSQDNKGLALLSESRKVSFNNDNRLFVCDQDDSNGVVILNEEMELIEAAKNIGVEGAYAVCGDGKGNIFVCGHSSHNVIQIRNCGSKVGEVLNQSDGLYSPRSACFHSKTNRLFVTCLDDDITMFELQ